MASKKSPLRIVITTGDADGIGWEVTVKALSALGPQPGVQFFVFRSEYAKTAYGPRRFKSVKYTNLKEARNAKFTSGSLIEIYDPSSPAHWVERAAQACLKGEFQALVTGPLSKTSVVAAGMNDIGHTEILARVSGCKNLFMGFVGQKFSVVLATGHQPLARALNELNPARLKLALQAARQLRPLLPLGARRRPVALVGVNPHAGEEGLIGQEEKWFRTVIASFLPREQIAGPLVPDAAFLPHNWPLYSVYVCPYHDQGLIPFKLIHGFDSGVHLTLGLPFVRTSVDHGTAKDLFGKNLARSGSMKDALMAAIRLNKGQKS